MRLAYVSVLCCCLLVFGGRLRAASKVQKDAIATNNLQVAIAALGGNDALLSIADSVTSGTITPTAGSPITPATFVWKTLGTEVRFETTRNSSTQIFVSGHGKPAVSNAGTITALSYHMATTAPAFHLAALLLSAKLTDPNSSLIDAGKGSVNGNSTVDVQTNATLTDTVAAVTQQTWYIDAKSGVPLRVEYRLPSDNDISFWVDAATEFSDYRQVGALYVPYSMTYYESGIALSTITLSSVDFNVGLDPADFDLLGGGK